MMLLPTSGEESLDEDHNKEIPYTAEILTSFKNATERKRK